MKCSYCNAELRPNEHICDYCNMYNKIEEMKEAEQKKVENKNLGEQKDDSKIMERKLKRAFFLAFTPLIFLIFIRILALISEELVILLSFFMGPVILFVFGCFVYSAIVSIKCIKKNRSALAIITFILSGLPFIIFITIYLFSLIAAIFKYIK